MKTNLQTYLLACTASIWLIACGNLSSNKGAHKHANEEATEPHKHEEEHAEKVYFSQQQFQALAMKVDTLPLRNITSYIEANGQLEVPPQNEATVTAIIGANIVKINVIEGDKVEKGQVLAYISHPDLIKLQTDYINHKSQLQYLEKEYQRQRELYKEKIASGREFQKTQADYRSVQGNVKGYEAQLKQMGLNIDKIERGVLYEQVPVFSPIGGYIRLVAIKTGQYVQPQTEMFEIVNIDHIHADLMVFERDIHKVKEGQKILFTVESLPGKTLEAVIYAVGKSFEQNPKAIHIHAEIKNKEGLLIPGMYVRGRIMADAIKTYAMTESGLVREGEKYFIFTAKKENDNGVIAWAFEPVEVIAGTKDDGWIEVKLLKPLEKGTTVAWNNAYYLMADMKKEEAEHSH